MSDDQIEMKMESWSSDPGFGYYRLDTWCHFGKRVRLWRREVLMATSKAQASGIVPDVVAAGGITSPTLAVPAQAVNLRIRVEPLLDRCAE